MKQYKNKKIRRNTCEVEEQSNTLKIMYYSTAQCIITYLGKIITYCNHLDQLMITQTGSLQLFLVNQSVIQRNLSLRDCIIKHKTAVLCQYFKVHVLEQ